MPKMTCVQCQTGYKPYRNGVYLVETFLDPPKPYKVWHADMWTCTGCNHKVVSGYGMSPLKEHFHEDFDEWFDNLVKSDAVVVYDYE